MKAPTPSRCMVAPRVLTAPSRARAAATIASLSSSVPRTPSERVSARGVAPASELPRRRDEGQVEEEADEAAQEEAPKDEAEIQVDRFASSVLGIVQFGCTLLINSSLLIIKGCVSETIGD
uniref:Uncharacterized protein n=1 Tax=Setaria italica TaxID=4555 RepID=K4AGR2_SETIT